MKQRIAILCAVLAGLGVFRPAPPSTARESPPAPPPFLGEILRYTMTILGVAGGELTLSARATELDGKPAWKFEMSAISNEMLSKLFLVRDYMASWVDPATFRSLRFEKHTVEGKRVKDELIEFDYEQGVSRRAGKTIPIEGQMFDSLSSVYYLRTLDLAGGQPIELKVVTKAVLTLKVQVQGRETITTPAGVFKTIRVEPKSEGGSGLIGKGQNLILWLTDDEHRMPVQLRSKLKVGTLIGKLRAVERSSSGAAF